MKTVFAHGNLLLSGLDPSTRAELDRHFERQPFAHADGFYSDGDELRTAWFVEQGLISLVTTLSDGFTVENTAVGREGVIGLTPDLQPARAFGDAIGQTHGETLRIDLAALREVASGDEQLRHRLSLSFDLTTADTRQQAACLARHEVHQRLARWLLRSQDRLGSDRLPLTQEFIGHMLGTRRSTVSTVAQDFEQAGLIRYSRGVIQVLDRPGLQARTCECYATMKQRALDLGLEPPEFA